jgi:potassium efflux system protein
MRVNVLRESVAVRRRAEAEKRSAESLDAEKAASGKHAAVVKLSEENARLVQELNSVAEVNGDAIEARNTVRDEVRRVERDYRETKQKIDVAGRSRALGHLLVEEYRSLPDFKQYEGQAKTTRRKIGAVSLRLLETEESIKSPAEVGLEVQDVMKRDVAEAIVGQERTAVESEVRQLLTERQAVLRKLADAYTSYLDTLSDLDNRQREAVEALHKYRTLLDEWILWVPSTTPLGKSTFAELRDLTTLYISPSKWKEVWLVIWADFARAPLAVTLFVVFFILLLWGRRRLRRKFVHIEQQVENPETDRFALTLSGLFVTVILSLPLPLLFAVLGWRLEEAPEATEFAQALGRGFSVLVLPALCLRTFYHFCSPNGVGVVHFKWSERAAALLRRHLLWYTLLFLLLVFTIAGAWQAEEAFRSRGGMFLFIVLMGASALFLQRVLRPRGGAVEQYLTQHPDGWLASLRRLWYPAAICTPLVLVGLAATGYLYTAVVLSRYVTRSFWLMLAALVLHELVVRWLSLADRRVTRKGGEDHGGTAMIRNSTGAGPATDRSGPPAGLPDAEAQTLRMFHFLIGFGLVTGLLMVWSDILPALSILQQVKLWQHTAMIDGKEVQQPFTLWSLAVMGILVAVTVALWRNLPGVIDLALLQRVRISEASRYAIRRMIRYCIVAIGIVAVFKSIGGEWSQIQWLIAALSVGLGFGLQEIVANFISGIIILFEQPIRVGDVVTIGDVSGKVARIDIRATTITDFDNKDLVVPNKSFITGQLINWTLTSPVTRLTIKVGIAYGSDTALAHRVMLETVQANTLVLKNPEPKVFFTAFGESSLDFTVYVFVKELADRLPLTHELHMAIERALREQGVEIPFPQRDVHVRSLPPSGIKKDQ